MVWSGADMRRVVEAQPFDALGVPERHCFVTFLPSAAPALETGKSPRGDAELLLAAGREVYWVAYDVGGGYGSPPQMRVLKMPTTTRNLNVVKALAEKLA